MGAKVSEYHTGYRAFSRGRAADGFHWKKIPTILYLITKCSRRLFISGSIPANCPCPTRYEPESSSISLTRQHQIWNRCVANDSAISAAEMGIGQGIRSSDQNGRRLTSAQAEADPQVVGAGTT